MKYGYKIFGTAKLNDPRRTKRLVKIVKDMTTAVDKSIAQASLDPAMLIDSCVMTTLILQVLHKQDTNSVINDLCIRDRLSSSPCQ